MTCDPFGGSEWEAEWEWETEWEWESEWEWETEWGVEGESEVKAVHRRKSGKTLNFQAVEHNWLSCIIFVMGLSRP